MSKRENCEHRHTNGNCLFNGGFCLANDEEHCVRINEIEVINKFAEELKSRLGDAIHPKDFESMRNLIDDVVEEKKCDHYCHSCNYNYTTEDEEGLYYHHCRLDENAQ